MAMPTIRVSDEVYEELKRRAEPFVDTPDSVLRRVLALDSPAESGKTGKLFVLVEAGLLTAGEEVFWMRHRLGVRHVATVMANGSLRLADGRVAKSPSGACAMLSDNKSYDGWEEWHRVSDGMVIKKLRDQAGLR